MEWSVPLRSCPDHIPQLIDDGLLLPSEVFPNKEGHGTHTTYKGGEQERRALNPFITENVVPRRGPCYKQKGDLALENVPQEEEEEKLAPN